MSINDIMGYEWIWVRPIPDTIQMDTRFRNYSDIKRKDGAPRHFLRRILNYIK
jgi:hypothetical protein